VIGITSSKWRVVSSGWTPTMRAYAVDLLTWLWESRSPLPDDHTALAQLARADSRTFAPAWEKLSAPNGRGIFVQTEHGWICPLQDEARAHQQQRSRAGKKSVEARRQTVTGARPMVQIQTPAPIPPVPTRGPTSIEQAFEREREPEPPQLLPGNLNPADLLQVDNAALAVADRILRDHSGGGLMDWDTFRDTALAYVGKMYERLAPAEREVAADQTVLTYRVWDEAFLGGFRDRFNVTPRGISLRTTDRL